MAQKDDIHDIQYFQSQNNNGRRNERKIHKTSTLQRKKNTSDVAFTGIKDPAVAQSKTQEIH